MTLWKNTPKAREQSPPFIYATSPDTEIYGKYNMGGSMKMELYTPPDCQSLYITAMVK